MDRVRLAAVLACSWQYLLTAFIRMLFSTLQFVPASLPETNEAGDAVAMVNRNCTDAPFACLHSGGHSQGMHPEQNDLTSPIAVCVLQHPRHARPAYGRHLPIMRDRWRKGHKPIRHQRPEQIREERQIDLRL